MEKTLPFEIIIHHIIHIIPLDWIYISKKCSQVASEYLLTDPRVIPNKNDNEPIVQAAKKGYISTFKKLMADPRVNIIRAFEAIVEFDRQELFDLIDWNRYREEKTGDIIVKAKTDINLAFKASAAFKRRDMFCRLLEILYSQQLAGLVIVYPYAYFLLAVHYDRALLRHVFKLTGNDVLQAGEKILYAATLHGDKEIMQMYLDEDNPNFYKRAIAAAITSGNLSLTEELLANSAFDFIPRDMLLEIAIGAGDVQLTSYFLDKVDITAIDKPKLMRMVATSNPPNKELVELFLSLPYMTVTLEVLPWCANRPFDIFQAIFARVPHHANRPLEYISMLEGAIRNGREENALLILSDERVPNWLKASIKQQWLLEHAVRNNLLQVTRILLTAIDYNDLSSTLLLAVTEGRTEIVKLLLAQPQVDPSANENEALKSAKQHGHEEIVQLLIQHPSVDPIASAELKI